jgi:hypothetical protein
MHRPGIELKIEIENICRTHFYHLHQFFFLYVVALGISLLFFTHTCSVAHFATIKLGIFLSLLLQTHVGYKPNITKHVALSFSFIVCFLLFISLIVVLIFLFLWFCRIDLLFQNLIVLNQNKCLWNNF